MSNTLISVISIIVFLGIVIGLFTLIYTVGKSYGEELVQKGLITERERLDYGYVGFFLARIFGF